MALVHPEDDKIRGDVKKQPSFMGKNQVDGFKTLNDPLSVDRGGRTVPKPDELDNVGIEPAMNPPMAVPTPPNIDDEGVNSLYS